MGHTKDGIKCTAKEYKVMQDARAAFNAEWTTRQVADYFRISAATVRRDAALGVLPASRRDDKLVFRREDVTAFLTW